MGEPAEALSACSRDEIRGRPCCHAWLVCLSKCLHGDHWQGYWCGKVYSLSPRPQLMSGVNPVHLPTFKSPTPRISITVPLLDPGHHHHYYQPLRGPWAGFGCAASSGVSCRQRPWRSARRTPRTRGAFRPCGS